MISEMRSPAASWAYLHVQQKDTQYFSNCNAYLTPVFVQALNTVSSNSVNVKSKSSSLLNDRASTAGLTSAPS